MPIDSSTKAICGPGSVTSVGVTRQVRPAGRSVLNPRAYALFRERSVRQSANGRCPDTSSLRSMTAATHRRVANNNGRKWSCPSSVQN
jgi:hypothetical protein